MIEGKTILVSIIIPMYNCSEFIVDCLTSVLNQTYSNIEIIIVDDGSNDDTLPLAEERLIDCQKPYLIVCNRNRGASGARNIGIKLAQGRYVSFLDADDLLTPDAISIMMDAIQSSGANICFCDYEYFIKDYEYLRYDSPDFDHRANVYDQRHVWGGVYSKICIGLFDEEIEYGEDVLFNIAVGRIQKECLILKNKLYYYRNNPNSVTSKLWRTTQQAEYSLKLAKQIYKLLFEETNQEMKSVLYEKFRKAKNAVFGELYASEDYDEFDTTEIDRLRLDRKLLNSVPIPIIERLYLRFPFLDTFSFYKIYRKMKKIIG